MTRIFDAAFAFLGLLATMPVVMICAVIISLTSPGPPIFAQPRVGRYRRPFTCYKLRTMRRGTISAASHEVSPSAVTPFGGILRRIKLDELPQLWNVLLGEMSLVGPRPCLPTQIALISAREARGVYSLRPGITGPAQVRGVDMSHPEKLAQVDETWLLDHSLRAYFRFVVLTIIGRGRGDRVRVA